MNTLAVEKSFNRMLVDARLTAKLTASEAFRSEYQPGIGSKGLTFKIETAWENTVVMGWTIPVFTL